MATQVSGDVSGTWDVAGNPYQIVGDITIPAGQNLTIQPGVLVEAMGNFRITAQGTLIAVATEADSIRFLNGQADPHALWKGIRLENTALLSNFSNCYIENAEYGINSINSPANIYNSTFNRNTKGIQTYGIGTANPAFVLISHCIIKYSGENGVLIVQNSNTTVSNCEIFANGQTSTYRGAIQLSNQSAGGSNNPSIIYNHIHHNRWQGITAWDIVAANAIQPEIANNLIEYNLTGIYLLNASGYVHDNIIRYNFIPDDMNSGAGIMVSGATSVPYFERNVIRHNFTGFYITNNAMPVLGDLSIYHAWAQGENIIQDNIDAQGVHHSVVCASYPNASNVIKAENNYWDFNTAAEIASYITDHEDDAALPSIDFEPFLIFQNTVSVDGVWTYAGQFLITNPQAEIVAADDGEILAAVPISSGNFSISFPAQENFYLLIMADVIGAERTVFGAYGGVFEPAVVECSPGTIQIVLIQTIVVSDQEPWSYERVGTPTLENNVSVYPVQRGFFVYAPKEINYLYQDEDYLYLKRHKRLTPQGEQTFLLPPFSIWQKVQNLQSDDNWIKTEIIDDSGTILQSQVLLNYVYTDIAFSPANPVFPLYRQTAPSGDIILQDLFATNKMRFIYAENNIIRAYRIDDSLVEPDGTSFPLVQNNTWRLNPWGLMPRPSNLAYRIYSVEPEISSNTLIRFFWQAPCPSQEVWTGYRIYNNTTVIAEIPYNQSTYDYIIPSGMSFIRVAAFNPEAESELSDGVVLETVGADDPALPTPSFSYGPNPFNPRSGSIFKARISYPRASNTKLNIYNLKGQLVKTTSFGNKTCIDFAWDGTDLLNRDCSAGVYFLVLSADGYPPTRKKIILIK